MENARSIFTDAQKTQAQLNNIQAGIIENLQKNGLSFRLKSKNANLEEKAGSYEFKRYENSVSQNYGTARAAGKGNQLTAPPITVNVDQHKEIVEEVTKFDAERFGIDKAVTSIVERRKGNHEMTMLAEVETAFFAEAKNGGTAVDGHIDYNGNIEDQIEDIIQKMETTKNKYVRGVNRSLMAFVACPKLYGKLKNKLNNNYNANFAVADEELPGFNGVAVFSCIYLPEDVDYILIVLESVAQPLTVDEYAGDRIPMSNDFAVELFYDYGTKTLAGDLILYGLKDGEVAEA